ncbi:DUF4345 domain-containing protein [Sphingopyxis sp.]|uniref:DUF4345 domain-containing protein n=1 Tax=Sphingopyxis sp. TaxID=1908224 RepID=UPI003D6D4E91
MTHATKRSTRLLFALLYSLGASCAVIALFQIALGLSAIPGAGHASATVDSEHRFYAIFFLGFGIALIWCARSLAARLTQARFLLALFFAGGLARLVSIVQVGPPSDFFLVLTGIELTLPVLMIALMGSAYRTD